MLSGATTLARRRQMNTALIELAGCGILMAACYVFVKACGFIWTDAFRRWRKRKE